MARVETSIQVLRGTIDAWNKYTKVPLDGQPLLVEFADGYRRLKFGDGANTFSNLKYIDQDIYLSLAGGTLTGSLDIYGNASQKPLRTRGIVGSDGQGNDGDLFLQYGNDGNIYFGKEGRGCIDNDGLSYNGTSMSSRYPLGFASYSTDIPWGVQTGTPIAVWNDSTGGSVGFRRDCPTIGQTSMVIDGRVYQDEGRYPVLDSNNYTSVMTKQGICDILGYTPGNGNSTVTGVKGNAETSYRTGNVNITAENVGALSLKNGGNVTGDTSFQGKRRVHYVDDGTGRAGYDKIARFTANSFYNNEAIEIELARRTDTVPTHVAIMFAGNACYAVTCMGHTKDIFMCKESDGVWVLYVKKTHEWCTTSVLDYVHSPFADGVTVEWIVSSSANYAESLPNTEIISGSWGYIVKEAMEADGTATVLDYNDTSKKIKVGWVGNSLSQDQILGVACYASGDDDIVKAKIKDVSKDTFKNWLGGVSPAGGSEYYVKNENLSNVDLNNVTTTGIYHLTGTLTNSPLSCNATLFVDFSVGTPYQIFIPDYMYVMYKRNYSNGSWGNWQELNTWRPLGTGANDACAGNDSRLSNARPASDVYAWAKASSKPAYNWNEINNKPTTFNPAAHTHAYLPLAGGTMTGALDMNGNNVKLYGNNHIQANEQDINIIAAGKNSYTGYVNARVTSALQVRDTSNSSWKPVSASSFNQQSSRRYKKNIEDMTDEEARQILQYRVVDYDYINEVDGTNCQGMVAEEVAEINEYPVYRTSDGTVEGLDYSRFVPQLIKMVQIQQKEIDFLKTEIETLKNN